MENQGKTGVLYFNKETTTLLLNIKLKHSFFDDVQNIAENAGISKKTESHITLIGSDTSKTIQEKLDIIDSQEREKLLSDIEKLSREFTWQFYPEREYYSISKIYPKSKDQVQEERKSIIQIVKLSDLVAFYTRLNELLETNFDIPFPHITLFTTSTRRDKKL